MEVDVFREFRDDLGLKILQHAQDDSLGRKQRRQVVGVGKQVPFERTGFGELEIDSILIVLGLLSCGEIFLGGANVRLFEPLGDLSNPKPLGDAYHSADRPTEHLFDLLKGAPGLDFVGSRVHHRVDSIEARPKVCASGIAHDPHFFELDEDALQGLRRLKPDRTSRPRRGRLHTLAQPSHGQPEGCQKNQPRDGQER